MAEIIWKTSVPSSAFLKGAAFSKLSGRRCSLAYSYEGESDYSTILENLIFGGVESFKCTYYKACSLEMLEAYDKVLDLDKSEWLAEIIRNLSDNDADSKNLKHFRIYFDDGPCYEFICRSFEVVSEEQNIYPVNPVHPV